MSNLNHVTIVTALVATMVAGPGDSIAAPQSRAQRRCVSALHRATIGAVKAQARRSVACLRSVADGDEPDLQACVHTDGDGRVTQATSKTTDDAVRHCAEDPAGLGIPRALELTMNEAALTHAQGLVADLFGDDPASVRPRATDKTGARCQRAALGGAQNVVRAMHSGFLDCANRALRGGTDDPRELAACIDSSKRADRGAVRLAKTVDRRCADATLLPGVCAGAAAGTLGECIAARARCRGCRLAATAAGVDADCDLVDDGTTNDSCTFLVSVSGNALNFVGGTAAPIVDGQVTILELPGRQTTTGSGGAFGFDDLPEGGEVTFVLSHPDYYPIQTGTHRLGARDVERITFQAVTFDVFDAFGALLAITPDPSRCQMVTTVTRVGKSIYDPGAHGEDRVVVDLDPPLAPDQGPIYFNSSVLPDRSLVETSDDGGVLYVQVPPDEYEWTAFKRARVFTRVKMKCRAGFLVNASPPWGLQTH